MQSKLIIWMAWTIGFRIPGLFFWQYRNQSQILSLGRRGAEPGWQGVEIWSWYRICFRVGLHEYSSPDPLHSLREVNPIDQPCIMDSVPLVFPRFYDGAIGKFGCEGVFWLIGGYDVCVDAEGCLYEGRTGAWQFYVFCGVCGSMCRDLMVVWWRWWEGRLMNVFGRKLF